MRKPFFRSQTQSWYVRIDGKQVNLGKDKDAAFRRYHELMAGRAPVEKKTPAVELIGRFLDWCERHKAPRTHEWYATYCLSFGLHIGGRLTVQELKSRHVTAWLDSAYPNATDNTRNGAVRAVMRCFNFAVKQGDIEANPLKGVERPAYQPRECYIKPEEWQAIMAAIPDGDPFRDLLTILRETGCRPFEARSVEARHFKRDAESWVFPIKESKGKKRARVVPLNRTALAITQRLALKHPEGPLFRNRNGRPWTEFAMNCRFRSIAKKTGVKVFAYAFRHSFVTDALMRGVDPITLAHIVGHKDATMIMRVYEQLGIQQEHIRAALRKATGEDEPGAVAV